ncbi:MAG: DUF262 domain-containing protein [Thermodesulfobacteriota bacterium]
MNKTANKNPFITCKSSMFSKLFHKGQFEIPWHQRKYDWRKDHVLDLLRDIDESVQQKSECYFLGSVMLVEKEEGVWEINDGQQRMVTFSLICACLSRLFLKEKERHNEALALRVVFDLDENHMERLSNADNFTPRLIPPRDDQSRYNLMVRGKDIGTNGRLTDAWREIEKVVSSMGLDKATSFLDFLLNRVEVACLYIPKEKVDPNAVFETINYRGKQLEDFDLIRNDLYSYFSGEESINRRDTVHDNLERMKTQIGSATKSAQYSRCYFQCQYGFLPKKSFYRKTRNEIRTETQKVVERRGRFSDYAYDLVNDFTSREQVELFRLLANPDAHNSFIEGFSRDSKTGNSPRGLWILLDEMSRYSVVQPMVFALLCRYLKESNNTKKKKTARFVYKNIKKIASLVMRTAFVSKFEPSHFESEFSTFAQRIWSVKSLEDINIDIFLKECDNSNEGVMDDDKFKKKAEYLTMDGQKAKFFLLSLNHSLQQDRDIINGSKCTVEHVLPQSDRHWGGWRKFEDPGDWVRKFGNLTLLGPSDNKSGDVENKDFAKKKQFLHRSAIKISQEIAHRNDWSPSEIEKRQKKLVGIATQVWSFS